MGGNDGLNLYTAAMRKPARVKRNKAATEAPGKGQVVAFLFEGGGLEFREDPAELIWLATSNEIRPRKFHFMTDKFHKVKSACYWNQ